MVSENRWIARRRAHRNLFCNFNELSIDMDKRLLRTIRRRSKVLKGRKLEKWTRVGCWVEQNTYVDVNAAASFASWEVRRQRYISLIERAPKFSLGLARITKTRNRGIAPPRLCDVLPVNRWAMAGRKFRLTLFPTPSRHFPRPSRPQPAAAVEVLREMRKLGREWIG